MYLLRLTANRSIQRYISGQCKQLFNSNSFSLNAKQLHISPRQNVLKPSDLKTPELKSWDPEFSEGAFIYGSTQAICRITEIISNEDKYDELKDLVTPSLRRKLHTDIKLNLSDLQKKIIYLKPTDIKLLIPVEVRLQQLQESKQCVIGLRTLAIKWQEIHGAIRLAIIALQTEFIRNYMKDKVDEYPEWTIRVFDILECAIAGEVRGSPRKYGK